MLIKNYFLKKYKVLINSICADEYIEKPIIEKNKINPHQLKDFINVLNISSTNYIKYIIVPFVDNSSICNLNFDKLLTDFLNKFTHLF